MEIQLSAIALSTPCWIHAKGLTACSHTKSGGTRTRNEGGKRKREALVGGQGASARLPKRVRCQCAWGDLKVQPKNLGVSWVRARAAGLGPSRG